MERLHQSGEIIAQRYRILDMLGQGGVGTTYEAQDLESRERVALKVLSLRRMTDWKKMELFEREAHILAQLNHPAIPRYLDYFQVDTDRDRNFYIAQQLATGKSLAVLVEKGWYPDFSEVRRIAIQVLSILIYLHDLIPPVIHRDIKPQNIIRQDNGQVFLVDFGAVQDTYHHTVTGGSTVVGTYGYMAPEQFRGQAVLSTDLYGLGTTLLFLLTRKSPADLPQRQLKIDFRPYVRVNQKFANWLDKMLEPASEDRFSSAREALAVLQGEQTLPKSLPQPLRQPEYSPITLTKDGKKLIVRIPCVGLRSDYSQRFGLIVLLWNGILALMVWAVVALSLFIEPSRILIFIGFALIGLWMLRAFLYSALSSTQIEIDPHNFRIQKWLLGWRYENIQGYTANIKQVNQHVIAEPLTRTLVTVCVLKSKSRQHDFGLLLTQWEKDWLVEQIRYALFGRN